MILQETYKLENGTKIPKLGLGTWCIDNDKAAQTVRTAVTLGYRLIDTAQAYKNEQGVGEGIRSCSVSREELFVASKVAAELKTYEAAAASIEETLEKMGLDYLDQMIIHAAPLLPRRQAAFRFHGLSDNRLPPAQRTVSDERLNCSPFGVLATGYIQTQYLPFHRSNRKRTQAFSRPSCPGFRYSQGLCLECF